MFKFTNIMVSGAFLSTFFIFTQSAQSSHTHAQKVDAYIHESPTSIPEATEPRIEQFGRLGDLFRGARKRADQVSDLLAMNKLKNAYTTWTAKIKKAQPQKFAEQVNHVKSLIQSGDANSDLDSNQIDSIASLFLLRNEGLADPSDDTFDGNSQFNMEEVLALISQFDGYDTKAEKQKVASTFFKLFDANKDSEISVLEYSNGLVEIWSTVFK